MNEKLFSLIFDERFEVANGRCLFEGNEIPFVNGILRFTPNISYSTGNFARLREDHSKLQLDSVNGTQDRLDTILSRTNWPPDFFRGKLLLECGCGAGPDAEILRSLGAKVVSVDIAGVDVSKENLGSKEDCEIVQASIVDLPFKKQCFDIVWCHRVLQHTPNPPETLKHILSFVKDDGAVFVHSYSKTFSQLFSWKYAMRPITKRMDPERLYKWVGAWVPAAYKLTNFLHRIPPDKLGEILFKIAYYLVPIRNYRFNPEFSDKSDEYVLEYAVHDTFDALSPKFDAPMSVKNIRVIAKSYLKQEFEVIETGVTLLRTKVPGVSTSNS